MSFGQFIRTFDQMRKIDPNVSEGEFDVMVKDNRRCQCGRHVWRYARTGLCFSCTTGEHDPSNDYEVGNPY